MWYPPQTQVELEALYMQNTSLLQNRSVLLDKLPKHSVGAELGVEYGNFSKDIMELVQPKELHLVDLWESSEAFKRCKTAMNFDQVKMHKMDSIGFLNSQADNSLDWVYIDTDHGYEVTKKELEASARVVKDSGFICGHDYTNISNSLRPYGVVAAVNEFCSNHSYELVYLTNEADRHLSFALRRMS